MPRPQSHLRTGAGSAARSATATVAAAPPPPQPPPQQLAALPPLPSLGDGGGDHCLPVNLQNLVDTSDWPSSATSDEDDYDDKDTDNKASNRHRGGGSSDGFSLLGVTVRRAHTPWRVDTAAHAFDRDGDGTLDKEELRAYFEEQWLNIESRRRAAGPRRRCCIGMLRATATVSLATLTFAAIVALATVPRLPDFDRFDREEIYITRAAAATSSGGTHHRHAIQVSHDGGDPSRSWTDVIGTAANSWANCVVITAHPQNNSDALPALTPVLRPARVFHFDFPAMRRFPPWFLRALTLDTLDFTVMEIALMLDINLHKEHLPHLATFLLHESRGAAPSSAAGSGSGVPLFSRQSGEWWSAACRNILAGAPAQFSITNTQGVNCKIAEQPDPPVDTRSPFIFVFAVLNVCISIAATLWLLHLARHVAVRLWGDAVAGIGREFFEQRLRRTTEDSASVCPADHANASAHSSPDPDVLDVVDVNPLFLLDCLVAESPVDCELLCGPAALSVAVHILMVIVVPVLPMVMFVSLVGCSHVDRDPWTLKDLGSDDILWCEPGSLQIAGLAVLLVQCLMWSVYSVSWHAGAPDNVQRRLLTLSMFTWLVVTGLSTLYTVNVFLWLCLVLLVHPVTALALLVLLSAGPTYVYFAVSQFRALQKALKDNMKSVQATRAASIKAARAAGLDNATVVSLVVVGALIILATVSWLILGYLMLVSGSEGAGLESQVGQLAAAVSAAFAGFGKLRHQIGKAKARLKRNISSVVENPAAQGFHSTIKSLQSGAESAAARKQWGPFGDSESADSKRD